MVWAYDKIPDSPSDPETCSLGCDQGNVSVQMWVTPPATSARVECFKP